MNTAPVDLVRERLQKYADRGVFQGLTESPERSGKTRFGFRWLLGNEFSLIVDPRRREIVVRNLLPAVEHRSFMDSDLRRFIAGRTAVGLPSQRLLDGDRVSLAYTNRQRTVSLVMEVLDGGYGDAVRALLGTLNDLFAYIQLYHIDYLHRNFRLPEE